MKENAGFFILFGILFVNLFILILDVLINLGIGLISNIPNIIKINIECSSIHNIIKYNNSVKPDNLCILLLFNTIAFNI